MSSMTASSRRASKAEERAAKERRQRNIAIGAAALLVVILAYEIPHTLSLSSGGGSSHKSSTAAPATPPAPSTGSSTAAESAALKAALRQAPRDVFLTQTLKGEVTFGTIPNPPGLRDPFAEKSAPEATAAPPPPKAIPVPSLPGTIVIGTPGGGRVAEKGWIVILASIPTGQGEGSAKSFVTAAKKAGVGGLLILNSSNRRPLRGGYWVVYTGPWSTLALVNQHAAQVHSLGFPTAYIRELIVYRKK